MPPSSRCTLFGFCAYFFLWTLLTPSNYLGKSFPVAGHQYLSIVLQNDKLRLDGLEVLPRMLGQPMFSFFPLALAKLPPYLQSSLQTGRAR